MTEQRAPRADAQRNRDRLLVVAAQVLGEQGTGFSMEAIARKAGVGVGTIYRHFPTREALVEAVYRQELARLCDAAPELLETMPADRALRAWMDRMAAYMATKQELAEALRQLIAAGGNPFAESRSRMTAAIDLLMRAGVDQGILRSDVDADDLLVGLSGLSAAATDPERRKQTTRLLDVLVDGLRTRG